MEETPIPHGGQDQPATERRAIIATYIVTYDLNKETVRPKIVDAIKQYGTWAKLSESSYAIAVNKTPVDVYNDLLPLLDGNDQIYVITLRRPYYGQGSEDVNKWLEDNLS